MLESTIYVTLFVSTATLSFDSKLLFTQTFWCTSFCLRAHIIPKKLGYLLLSYAKLAYQFPSRLCFAVSS
jgi:hypothetical protein